MRLGRGSGDTSRVKHIGMAMIAISILLMVAWETYGREALLYDRILVLKQDIEQGTIITREMLGTRKVANVQKDALTWEEAEGVVGLSAVQFVKGGVELFDKYFEKGDLIVSDKNDCFVLSIPNQWLESYPQSLRRGDTAYFYSNSNFVAKAKVAYAKNGSNQEVTSVDTERLEGSGTISLVEVVVDSKQAALLSNIADQGNKFVILYN